MKQDLIILEIILREYRQAQMYVSEKIRNIKMIELEAKAHIYGYSFQHFTEFGTWRKYTEIEPVSVPCNCEKSRVFASLEEKPQCKLCGNQFTKTKPNKVFCSEICKNKFHNINKPQQKSP